MWFSVSFLVSVALLTAFGHWWLSLGALFVMVGLGLSLRSRRHSNRYIILAIVLGTIGGRLVTGLFHMSTTPCVPPQGSTEGVLSALRKPGSVEVTLDDGQRFIVQGSQRSINASQGDQIKVSLSSVQCAKPHTLSRGSFTTPPFLQEEFDYPLRLRTRGYQGSAYGTVITTSPTHSLRTRIITSLQEDFSGNALGLIVGMSIGGRAFLDDAQYEEYIQSGLVHLIAVSGSNLAFVAILVGYCFFWLPVVVRKVVVVCAMVLYTILCGSDSSILRAAVFGLLTYITIIGGLRIARKRLIMYTLIILVTISPYSLIYDVGLQLSLFAVIGIRTAALLTPSRRPSLVRNRLIPTFAATLGVTPVLLITFQTLNLTSMVSTILVTPIVAPVSILTIVSRLSVRYIDTLSIFLLRSIVNGVERAARLGVSISVWVDSPTTLINLAIATTLTLAYGILYQYGMKRKRVP